MTKKEKNRDVQKLRSRNPHTGMAAFGYYVNEACGSTAEISDLHGLTIASIMYLVVGVNADG
jgi:hypothetical protein